MGRRKKRNDSEQGGQRPVPIPDRGDVDGDEGRARAACGPGRRALLVLRGGRRRTSSRE